MTCSMQVRLALVALLVSKVQQALQVHLVNVEQHQAAADPQTKPPNLGCESAYLVSYRLHITTIAIYYYSARKLILIYRPTERKRLS